jgi:hypothetical protein
MFAMFASLFRSCTKFRHQSEQPELKLVKATLADAKADFQGIRHVSGMAGNAASASDNLQFIPNAIDTFSRILGPLKVFNTVANVLADVRPFISILYLADLCG